MKCPVCKSGLKITNYHDDHIIMESESECTTCQRYKEHFAYGGTEAGVRFDTGWLTWQWANGTSVQDRGKINMEIELAAKSARSEWAATKTLRQRQQ
jgi:hypothetical protein